MDTLESLEAAIKLVCILVAGVFRIFGFENA